MVGEERCERRRFLRGTLGRLPRRWRSTTGCGCRMSMRCTPWTGPATASLALVSQVRRVCSEWVITQQQ